MEREAHRLPSLRKLDVTKERRLRISIVRVQALHFRCLLKVPQVRMVAVMLEVVECSSKNLMVSGSSLAVEIGGNKHLSGMSRLSIMLPKFDENTGIGGCVGVFAHSQL
ncbi:hypothetical protein Nepgr_017098 [Nepenthes gracilis]|uniref:Uncharacterized protein n=1 Tax=Nepenthes gracilis TaxID=150966 RepID=A0AAD3SRR6_NEPGR|nr:hypothetical protein Nepgr_017098 [Nepenthes gracilis]